MSYTVKKFNDFDVFSMKPNFPKNLEICTSTGTFDYKFVESKNDGQTISAVYTYAKNHKDFTYAFGEDNLPQLNIDEPTNMYIDLRFHTNEEGNQKLSVEITYGRTSKFEFSLERPDLLKIVDYNGVYSKLDVETKFAFGNESIKEFVDFFNGLGYNLTTKHFQFLDVYPYSYQHYEAIKLTPIFDGIILIVNNGEPNRRGYCINVEKFFQVRGINHMTTSSVTELNTILKTQKVIGIISTGSDYSLPYMRSKDEQELSISAMKSFKGPIIGMCYGFQSMANYYGGFKILDSGVQNTENIKLTEWDKNSTLFKDLNMSDFQFSVNYHDVVPKCPQGFKVIARHNGRIFAIENQELLRWGLAFHPEDNERTFPILDVFINICKEYNEKTKETSSEIKKFVDFTK